ncbi:MULTISPECIES: 50S ribosomal protein L11 methyltransferase [unclassified Thiomonas]|jgi:ribosomal protein L11 methyltransferase|uniref:50S ribosomal protein L11 methyltransferase n=1 Tax=unclassified Thiomonas TaxID=2625466 RepID=UPI0004DBAEC4|nr:MULTISPECIES: 50S ribosomal protein L11 methyltransferase [unclassified Thiomonas]MDD4999705.1 50S ribosomal protein L11 methyltransferase [Thiomonas arsenitoxydans]CDW93187.1 methylase for 50S ribosomal subunit protein L11 [Thiomonas sp. CB2]VDY06291.1 methylase for 50S ribosomal subunit protein L11 [Thiomonas sp. Bio17B3]VDY10413.1 methylase for 50S ribosomal subunit protein L11 [Thiomonas sp. Sup16B3]VDY14562.1 putative Ribosomal protein L11 methyltransferase (L11 Mtase) (prmA) [Thiomona
MTYREVTLPVSEEQADLLSDALMELGALSVSVEDRFSDTAQEQALYGEPGMPPPKGAWAQSLLRVLFADEAQADAALAALLAEDILPDLQEVQQSTVEDQDWVRLTQSQFQPVSIADALWIVPSWHEPPEVAAPIIRLDPGLAFGTGTHPTTRLCLEWLARQTPSQLSVLDYGCGSGILAIAAAKFGAGPVVGVDIDPDAVLATEANAAANDVTVQAGLPDKVADAQFDIVVANILSAPLKLLAPAIAAHVKPGGWLVLSGVLDRQAEELIAAYAPYCALQIDKTLDGWVCLAGRAHP